MMKLLMGTHTEVREFLASYLEGYLPLHKALQFRVHLLLCQDCQAYLARYNDSVSLARNYLDDPPPEELVELTLRFLHENTPEGPDDPGREPTGNHPKPG